MELVNKKYVKIEQKDLFLMMVECTDECSNFNQECIQHLIDIVMNYQSKMKLSYVGEFYLDRDSLFYEKMFNNYVFSIKRQTLINAFFYAGFLEESDILFRINSLITKKEVLPSKLGDLLDFVLENSMDINEYFDGEVEKIIYNDREDRLEKGYIYQENKQSFKRVLNK